MDTASNGAVTPREAEADALGLAPRTAWAEMAVSALLFLYPVLLLTVREGVNYCFALLVALALWVLLTGKVSTRSLRRGEMAYIVAMASLVLAIAVSQLWHWRFTPKPYDGASRFLLAVPIYLMLRSANAEILASVRHGIAFGAIAAAVVVLPQLPLADGARASTNYMDAIRFGDLALALGVLSIASIDVKRADSPWGIILKIAGTAAALFASIESGSRGGWIALPVVALTWWSLSGRGKLSWRSGVALAGALIVLAVVSYLFVGKVHERVDRLYADVIGLVHADLDTSLGERLQIWRVAIRLFAENPLFGIGPDEFQKVVPRMKELGLLTSLGLQTAQAEVHSEILQHTVSLGIVGFASIISIYAVPLFLFIRAAGPSSGRLPAARISAVMGACFVTGFLVFGLTIEIFNLKMIATFYSLTVAVLLAATECRNAPIEPGFN